MLGVWTCPTYIPLNAETLQLGCFTEIYNKSTREYEWRSEGVSREDLTAWSRTG